jgi:hypothetical protein
MTAMEVYHDASSCLDRLDVPCCKWDRSSANVAAAFGLCALSITVGSR